jgi:hypothetical protein
MAENWPVVIWIRTYGSVLILDAAVIKIPQRLVIQSAAAILINHLCSTTFKSS